MSDLSLTFSCVFLTTIQVSKPVLWGNNYHKIQFLHPFHQNLAMEGGWWLMCSTCTEVMSFSTAPPAKWLINQLFQFFFFKFTEEKWRKSFFLSFPQLFHSPNWIQIPQFLYQIERCTKSQTGPHPTLWHAALQGKPQDSSVGKVFFKRVLSHASFINSGDWIPDLTAKNREEIAHEWRFFSLSWFQSPTEMNNYLCTFTFPCRLLWISKHSTCTIFCCHYVDLIW